MSEQEKYLEGLVGKTITGFTQQPYPEDPDGVWRDDPPLYVFFEDGTILAVQASGFHQSGYLGLEVIGAEPPPCTHRHKTDSAQKKCEDRLARQWKGLRDEAMVDVP